MRNFQDLLMKVKPYLRENFEQPLDNVMNK
jgi:hypothetical protein